jgi:polar amino acid transport system substrate-binding protein
MRRITLALGVMLALLLFGAAMLGTAQSATTPKYGKCKPTGKYASLKLKTQKPGVLTVGYNTISPRTYRGNTPDTVNDGFNYCFAANIAWRAGIPKMKLRFVDFAQLIVGRLSGYDVAIDDFYIKPEREEKVDFSIPYGHSWTGLVARTDGPAPTQAAMKDLKYGVTLGSVQQKFLDEVLHPSQQYNTYDDTAQLFAALKAKQIDAVLIDLPVALPAATASNGDFKVFAQVKVGGQVGIVMIQPTPNRTAINKAVREMLKNGTLKNLEKKYYFAAYGGVDPDKLPVWG